MAYTFQKLPQLVDKREGLAERGEYFKRINPITYRVWHHSLTRKHLGGADAASFSAYHVNTLGWPGCGYTFVIEPKNVIDTPRGKRARIVWAHDIDRRSYHVGNSNDFSLGICVAGDYRYDELDNVTKASIDELHEALVKDNIGKYDKSHNEMPGYSWKACCVFNYHEAFKFLDKNPVQEKLPNVYVVQEGDTLWGLANNDDRFTVEDLMKWNNIDDPITLKIGQKLYLKQIEKKTEVQKEQKPSPTKVKWIGEVKVPSLNVRKGDSTSYPIVNTLKKGDDVTVYDEKNGWLYIGNGQWVSNVQNKYVAKKTQKSSLAGKRVEAKVDVRFYNKPSWKDKDVAGTCKAGWGFTIIDKIDVEGYPQYKVKNSKGNIYYITTSLKYVGVE